MRKAIMVHALQGILLGALVVGLFLAMPSVASAGLIGVRLTSGVSTVTCFDAAVCDTNPAAGAVTFSGVVGTFDVNVTTGVSYPVLGSPAVPWIDMNTVNVTSSGPGTLEVLASQTDYTGVIGGSHFHGGGTQTNMSSVHEVYLDNSNTQFGLATLIDSHPAPASGAFSFDNHPADPGEDGLYSLTLRGFLTAGSGTATTSFNHEYFVAPEPTWGLLLGPALGLVGLMGRRRRISVTA